MRKAEQREEKRTFDINGNDINVAVITSGFLPVPPTKGGAVESIIYNLMKENEAYGGCRFTIFSVDDENDESFQNSNVIRLKPSKFVCALDLFAYFCAKNVLHKEHLISYRYFFQRMEFMRKVGRILNKEAFDRVLLENNVIMFKALAYRDNLEKYKGKIYYHAHNEIAKTLGYEKYFPSAKRIISVSDYITDCYRKLIGASKVEYQTVHNVIDEKVFTQRLSEEEKAALKQKIGVDTRYPSLFFAGRLTKEKGIAELLEALAQLETDQYNLIIAGQLFFATQIADSFEAKLQAMMKQIRGNIIFTGFVPYQEMYKYYQIADLCVLPSTWNEPSGLTIIECIVSGTPLITTRTGGIPENATEATILLDTDRLVQRLKEQIGKYLSSPEELTKLKEETNRYTYRHGTLTEYYHHFLRALDITEK